MAGTSGPPKRRRWLFALVVCVVVVVLALIVWPGEREPEYQGKKLSEWMESKDPDQRAVAVRQIGTNALPWLLRWIHCDVPPWKTKLRGIMAKLPQVIQNSQPIRSLTWHEEAKHSMLACIGFQILGRQAKPAIPELIELAKDPKSPLGSYLAVSVLLTFRKDAIPGLLAILGNPQGTAWWPVMDHFRYGVRARDLGTNANTAVEILLRFLKDRNGTVRTAAARALGNLALQPEVVIPALAKSAEDSEWMVRARSVEALANFGELARPVTPIFLHALNDPDSQVRREATNTLLKVAPEALPPEDR